MSDNRETPPKNIENIKILRWWNMIFLGKGSFLRQIIHAIISVALRLFFRRIETANVEKVPKDEPIIFVLNHPNGLVDPALVFVSLPRRVSFLAKSTLFKIPIGGKILKILEALPVYRRIDEGEDMSKNLETFRVCRELLAQNRCIAIFPEGISHDDTKLKPIKTGTARIALGAMGISDSKFQISNSRDKITDHRPLNTDLSLKIMAVGLFYTSKTAFRSEVLIRYGKLIEIKSVELDENGEPPIEAIQDLTNKIEKALREVTLNLESAEELDSILKAEALFSSVYENLLFKDTLTQSFQQLQTLAEKYKLLGQNEPEKMRQLNEKISSYEKELKTKGVTLESLSVLNHPTWYVFRYLILRVLIISILSPFAVIGAIIHSPAYVFSNFIGLLFKTHGADSAGSTYKILASLIFMPLTWLISSLIIWWNWSWQIALISVPIIILCGYVALRSSEILIDLTVWLKSGWLLFRQKALFLRLLIQRETLQKEISEIIEK